MSFDVFRRLNTDLGLRQVGRWAAMTVLVGAVAAAGAIVFDMLQVFVETHFLEGIAHYSPPGHGRAPAPVGLEGQAVWDLTERDRIVKWGLVLVPMLGGLVAGLLVHFFAPEAEGHGTDAVIKSYHREGGRIRAQVPIIKLLASAITIGSGGSAGREGPIAQIGAGFGSWLASILRLSERERRTLVLAGVAAGVGAMFQAPLGGALFAAEVMYRRLEFESEALIPGVMASILSYSLFCLYSGKGFSVIFDIPEGMMFNNPVELILYGVVGLFMAMAGALYVKTFYFSRNRVFGPLPVPRALKPMIGGALVGCLALFFSPILGVSYGHLVPALWASSPETWSQTQGMILFFLALGFLKIIATSLTIGSGGSGGVFAPSLVIGGSFGAVFGLLFGYLFPGLVSQPGTYVLVGMGAFFSGVAKVPFTSLIMVCEMTSGYGLVVPLMLATAITYVFMTQRCTIYSEQVGSRFDSPAHQGEFMFDVLQHVKVREVMVPLPEVLTIEEETPLGQVLELSTQTSHQTFPVRNGAGEAVGVVSLEDVRSYYYQSELGQLIIAGDIDRPLEKLTPEDDLNTALQKLVQAGFEEYPVAEEETPGKVVGLISRRDLLSAYRKKFRERSLPSESVFQ
jgi:CIC family chloride channel protein